MWPQEDTGWAGGEVEGSEAQARDPPHCEPSVTWEHVEWGGGVRKGLGWGSHARDRGPQSGTLGCGGPTIFRPMYSQPGRTDSRKAFLWAPSENRVRPQWGLGGLHTHTHTCPYSQADPHPKGMGMGLGLSLSASASLWVSLCVSGQVSDCTPECLSLCLSVALCVGPVTASASVSPCDCT